MINLKSKKFVFIFAGTIAVCFILIYTLMSGKYLLYKPNIILIIIDALRPDHLSCYGYERNTSPNIDKLAKEGVMFTQAVTAGGYTVESISSILTGTYPFIHGIRGWHFPLDPSIKTLPQLLVSKNIKSALFTNHPPVGWMDIEGSVDSIYAAHWRKIDDYRLTRKVINWLKENKNAPLFIYIHYHGAHGPYRVPEPYKSKYLYDNFRIKKEIPISKDKYYNKEGKIPYYVVENDISDVSYYIAKYDGAISCTDDQIEYLMDSLEQLGLLEDTLIILTSDHGEMLGEHDIYFAHEGCYENNIRVPLIIRFPRLFPKGKIIPHQVSLIDIVPTVLEIMRINIPHYIQGKSLLALFKRDGFNLHSYVYTSGPKKASIRGEGWKLIRNGSFYELYNLVKDTREQRNLVNEEKAKFKELKDILERYEQESVFSDSKRTKALTDQQKEILRSLGYVQ